MWIGLFSALGACLIWGLIFIIPDFLEEYSPLEVALGRYFMYGVLSSFLFFRKGTESFRRIPWRIWRKGLSLGLFANMLYYVGVVIGLRYASAPVTVLILGMCPILVALYGNIQMREGKLKHLTVPCVGIGLGMILVNLNQLLDHTISVSFGHYCIGLLCVVGALISWSWFAVHNARFLKANPEIPRSEWSTILGVTTFLWVIGTLFILAFFPQAGIHWDVYLQFSASSLRFFLGTMILGFVCSWMGCFLWNQASLFLPVSVMGPLIIFETIFGLIFVYFFKKIIPPPLELVGIFFLLGSILYLLLSKRRFFPSEK